jgi:hypothetical protein
MDIQLILPIISERSDLIRSDRNSKPSFFLRLPRLSFPSQKSNRCLLYPILDPPVLGSLEARIIGLHLGHHTHHHIITLLMTGKPRVSRCILEFHRSDVSPKGLRIGRPSKRSSGLVAFIEGRTLQDPWSSAPELANEITGEFGIEISRTCTFPITTDSFIFFVKDAED